MINILFFIEKLAYNGSIGGAEKVLINLVNHMDQNQFCITVQTVYPETFSSLLNKGINYRYCYPKKNRFYQLLYRAEAEFGLVYPLHIKDDFDIEVAFLEFDTTKVIASSTNRNAKKYAWVHCDFDIAVSNKEAFVKKAAKQYSKFDKVVCVSDKCRESFISLFGNDPEAVVLHNVVDDAEIREKANAPLPTDTKKRKLTLLTVARFSPPKNYKRLLTTVKRLRDEGFDFDLWVVGDGEQRSMIEDIIKTEHLEDCVTLFGFQSNPYPLMREADLLVCSSDYEGFSTFITEGLILGKPIITTDCSGMRELLGDSEYGIITENDDDAFYKCLKKLLIINDRANELKEMAVKSAERGQAFSTETLVKNAEAFFLNA